MMDHPSTTRRNIEEKKLTTEKWDDINQLSVQLKKQQEINTRLFEMLLEEIRGMRSDAKRVADFLETSNEQNKRFN